MITWIKKFQQASEPVFIKPTFSVKVNGVDFLKNTVVIPTISVDPTIQSESRYFVSNAKLIDRDIELGDYNVTILCMKTTYYYITVTSNITFNNGLTLNWVASSKATSLTPAELFNGMITECIVRSNVKAGINPYYNRDFKINVSTRDGNIYFNIIMI